MIERGVYKMTTKFKSRFLLAVSTIAISFSLLLSGCSKSPKLGDGTNSPMPGAVTEKEGGQSSSAPEEPTPTPTT